MAFNIGINVVETEGKSTPAIAGAPTSVTGLILRSSRGPTDAPNRVSNFQQFIDRFGTFSPNFDGAYCVDGFFKNGGREAYIVRVLGTGSAAASVTLTGRTGGDSLTATAAYRGSDDDGDWGNDLYISTQDNPLFSTKLAANLAGNQPARLQGNAFAGSTVDLSPTGSDRVLQLEIDADAAPFTVTFNPETLPVLDQATAQDIADAINVVAGSRMLAQASSNGVLLISLDKGASSNVTVVPDADSTSDLLGFPAGNVTASGSDAVAAYTEAQVESISGLSIGNIIRLDDGISSDWRTITDLQIRDDGAGGEEYFVIWAEPALAERNEYLTTDDAALSTCEFNIVVSMEQPGEDEPVAVETWEKLSLLSDDARYAPLLINNAFSGSKYISLTDENTAFAGNDVPAPGILTRLGLPTTETAALTRTTGTDGAAPATADYREKFPLYDTIDIQLLAVPETMPDGMLTAVTRAGLDYAAGSTKGDCVFVGFTPAQRDEAGAKAYGQNFQAAKVYGAMYWPWVTVVDPAGAGANPVRTIPPVGHVLGVYARIDQTRGVWKAPAGNEATVRGVLSVEANINDIDHTDLVKNGSVNAIRSIRGAGIVVDSSRSLSTDSRWLFINVRLLFNYVKASLRDGLRWVKQEPNREDLWSKIKYNAVTPFLLRLFQQGAFGPGTADSVFTVICDASNNPPAQIELGNLQVEVYFYPSRPAETIIIMVGQQEGSASASEG